MARTAVDNAMPEEDRFASSATPAKCIEGFTWNEVNPCHADNYLNKKDDLDFPMYELNHRQKDGTPYFRITDLRADKIKNFMVVKDYQRVKYFRPFQYEAMVAGGEATNQLIRELEEATGLKAACAPLHESPIEQKETKFDKEFVEWMKQNVDWEAEGLVGYRKDDVPGASTETVEFDALVAYAALVRRTDKRRLRHLSSRFCLMPNNAHVDLLRGMTISRRSDGVAATMNGGSTAESTVLTKSQFCSIRCSGSVVRKGLQHGSPMQ
eukprot:CAMPEP_0194069678 /NCGR_PEP_ID=MMETSP0009_2-20130614/87774_1 /TAXON_ID=210454 /ORGANISM="Grammatophora oceanica, Strain CCMP 410" /LENGTH=266 /DNA_ID=CAMNT_0038722889 /DNA_START=42 /DNA_END=843 /DNA_ORIENTATION=-